MKKIQHSNESMNFPSVKLYRSDLNEILNKLNKVCSEVKLSNNTHEFENLDDAKNNLGYKIKNLKIVGREPYISIEFGFGGSNNVRLYISNDSDASKILFYELQDFLRTKLKWTSKINSNYIFWIQSTLLALLMAVNVNMNLLFDRFSAIVILTLFLAPVISSLFIIMSLYILQQKGSTIYLEHKHNISFWKKHRDTLIPIIIGGIIVSIISHLLINFLGYLSK